MMEKSDIRLSNLRMPSGSKSRRKIVGRGSGSGYGGTSTRGHKGQNSRSGGGTKPGFEGGQMPIQRRLPKRGFTNLFRESYLVVNVKDLERFENELTQPPETSEKTLAKKAKKLKILGDGEINKALTVYANKFSKSAVKKIEKAGGKAVTF